jgi:hypothetical protein
VTVTDLRAAHLDLTRTAGTLYDVFPGGCVTGRLTFVLGPSIALIQQFESAVGLYSGQQLRLDLKRMLGVELTS